jgi:hypothetical protein
MFGAVSTLLSLALLLTAPSVADSPVVPEPVSGVEGPAPPPPSDDAPAPDPDAPPPDDNPDAPPPNLAPNLGPDATQPPPESPGDATIAPWGPPTPTVNPAPPPIEDGYPQRDFGDMPYAATAARKSATQRNNDVLVRPFSRPVYSIAASGRFATLLGGGADIMQRFGYGFAAQLRIHFVGVVKSRFGVEIHAGHARFSQRRQYEGFDEATEITRTTLMTSTDFSAGPSMQIPLGPLFLQFGGSAGVALSTLYRPLSAEVFEDEAISTSNFMLRGGLTLGVPILNRHGLTFGAGVHHIFSPREVVIDPQAVEPVTTRPFGTWLEVLLGYQIWF